MWHIFCAIWARLVAASYVLMIGLPSNFRVLGFLSLDGGFAKGEDQGWGPLGKARDVAKNSRVPLEIHWIKVTSR